MLKFPVSLPAAEEPRSPRLRLHDYIRFSEACRKENRQVTANNCMTIRLKESLVPRPFRLIPR